MAISLADLKSTRNELPPRLLFHGVAGIGKTSLAAEFPNPVLLDTEEGAPAGVDMATFGLLTSYQAVTDAMGALAQEDHEFQTVILDSSDAFEQHVWRETCQRNSWKSIEDPGYGKGYLAADAVWNEFMAGCDYLRRERGMTVIVIAHSEVKQFDEPGKAPYSRYDLRMHKRGAAILTDRCDYILFVGSKTEIKEADVGFNKKHAHAEGGGARYIFADARPAFIAKNRSLNMPAQILYKKGEGFKALAPHIFPNAPAVADGKAAA